MAVRKPKPNPKKMNSNLKIKQQELIQQLEQAADAFDVLSSQEEQAPFKVGDAVWVDVEGERMAALVESIDGTSAQLRIQGVYGNEFEPTDLVVEKEMTELEEYAPEAKSGDFVEWQSEDGRTIGMVLERKEGLYMIEVFAPVDGVYEATGVTVSHGIDVLSVTDAPTIKDAGNTILAELKDVSATLDEETKTFRFKGIGSTYGNVDLGGDRVAKGAYTQTIAHRNGRVKLFFDHHWSVSGLAGIAMLSDSDRGLMVDGEMPIEASDVRDAAVKMKFLQERGEPLGLSIGYEAVKWTREADGTRTLNEIKLLEMTITPFPMDTHAKILEAKSRRIAYQAKKSAWETIKENDAPMRGNQEGQGEDSLALELKQLIQSLQQ